MLNSKYFTRADLQKCQEVVEGKRELYKEDRLYAKLYDHYVATGQMSVRDQNSMEVPAMSWVLEKLEYDLKSSPIKDRQ